MVHPAADVAQFIQRRELLAYERRVARYAYAYGVDLRRSAWLDASSFGDPIMRSVDRRWNGLVAELSGSILQPESRGAPIEVMEEIARIVRLLRAPLPTLRLLVRGMQPDSWPIVTPLGTTKGAVHWLVLDVDRLMACPPNERTFLLAGALSHLQCDHGPVITAHLMADRAGRGLNLVRLLLRPWSKLGDFSADRGALLALCDLGSTLAALRRHAEPVASWMPVPPRVSLREQALMDFDRSAVMVRRRMMPLSTAEAASVGPEAGKRDPSEREASDGAVEGQAERSPEPPASAPGPTVPADTTDAGKHPYREQAAEAHTQQPSSPDDELAKALVGAWSLARCDQRLTRRLGLL